jgi:hypothetical protein
MKKKIKFVSVDPGLHIDPPKPSSRFLPEWYRKLNPVVEGVESIKKCIPFLDSMTSGYMITLSADVYFNGESFEQVSKRSVVSEHLLSQVDGISLPEEYNRQPYKWGNMFLIQTPKGYSTMFTHPFNRIDLPFYALGGVVETDKFPVPVNFPFFIKKDFRGIIPAGTPIAQAIPFKRDDWEMTLDEESGIDVPPDYFNHANPPFNYYKRKFWKRKRYS